MITGRSAPRSSAIARSSAAPSGSGPSSSAGNSEGVPGSSPSMNTWSSGKSTNVGPEWAVTAAASASSTRPGISAVASGVAANFVSGRTNGTWSISCREPWPQRIAGARPPRTSIGEQFCSADAIALMPFVTPGPAVRAQTPGVRVTFAHPSAANAAVCSWRTSTKRMSSARHPSKIENKWPPDSVNSVSTPWALRRLATSNPPCT